MFFHFYFYTTQSSLFESSKHRISRNDSSTQANPILNSCFNYGNYLSQPLWEIMSSTKWNFERLSASLSRIIQLSENLTTIEFNNLYDIKILATRYHLSSDKIFKLLQIGVLIFILNEWKQLVSKRIKRFAETRESRNSSCLFVFSLNSTIRWQLLIISS